MRLSSALLLGLGVALQGCSRAPAAQDTSSDAELLHTAMRQLTRVIVYDIFSPPQASRVYAYASIAVYETLRQGSPEYQTLAGQVNGLEPVPAPEAGAQYYLPLAGVHAFMSVGRALTFSRGRMDTLQAEMDEKIRRTHSGISREVFERSIAYGDTVAQHILAWASKDRFLQSRGYPKYTVTSRAGPLAAHAAGIMDAVEPNWGMLRPFVILRAVSYGLPVRSFASFEQAASGAAISRLYGGIHFRRAIEEGVVEGRNVGQLVVQRVHTRASLAEAKQAGVARQ